MKSRMGCCPVTMVGLDARFWPIYSPIETLLVSQRYVVPHVSFPEHLDSCHLELRFESYGVYSAAVQKLYFSRFLNHITKFITLKRFGV